MTDSSADAEEWNQIESRLDAVLHGDVESLLDESLNALRSLQEEDDNQGREPGGASAVGRVDSTTNEATSDSGWTAPAGDFDPSSELSQVLDNLHRMVDDASLPAQTVWEFPAAPNQTRWTPVSGKTPIGYGKTARISGPILGIGDTAGLQPSAAGLERLEAALAPTRDDPIGATDEENRTEYMLPPPPRFNLTGPTIDDEESSNAEAVGDDVTNRQMAEKPKTADALGHTTSPGKGPTKPVEQARHGAFGRAIEAGDDLILANEAPGSKLLSRTGTGEAEEQSPVATSLRPTAVASPSPASPLETNTAETNTAETNTAETNTAETNTAETNTAETNTAETNTAETNTAIVAADVAADAPAENQPRGDTAATSDAWTDGANTSRRWQVGRRRTKGAATAPGLPLSQVVPTELQPRMTTSLPPATMDTPHNAVPAGTIPPLKPKAARPKNEFAARPSIVDDIRPDSKSMSPGLGPSRRNTQNTKHTKTSVETSARATPNKPPAETGPTQTRPTQTRPTQTRPTQAPPATVIPATTQPETTSPPADPPAPTSGPPSPPAIPTVTSGPTTPPTTARAAPSTKPATASARPPATEVPDPPIQTEAPTQATKTEQAASTLALFAAAGDAKNALDTGPGSFTRGVDPFAATDRSRAAEGSTGDATMPTKARPLSPELDIFAKKTDAKKPPSERSERVRGRASAAIDLNPSSQDELAESLESPRRGLGLWAGLLLLLIGLGAAGYSLIATAGGDDDPGNSDDTAATAEPANLVPIDPHTVVVEIDRCDEVGAVGTITNTSAEQVFVTVLIRFVAESGVLLHDGTLRSIEVDANGAAEYELKYFEDLVPVDLQGQTDQCSAEVQSVSVAG